MFKKSTHQRSFQTCCVEWKLSVWVAHDIVATALANKQVVCYLETRIYLLLPSSTIRSASSSSTSPPSSSSSILEFHYNICIIPGHPCKKMFGKSIQEDTSLIGDQPSSKLFKAATRTQASNIAACLFVIDRCLPSYILSGHVSPTSIANDQNPVHATWHHPHQWFLNLQH